MDSSTAALVHGVYDQFTEEKKIIKLPLHLHISYWKQLMHCCSEINPTNSLAESDIQSTPPKIIIWMLTNDKQLP